MQAPHKRPEAIDIAVILSRMLPPFEKLRFGAEFRWFNSVTLTVELQHVGRVAPSERTATTRHHAGVAKRVWEVRYIVEVLEAWECSE